VSVAMPRGPTRGRHLATTTPMSWGHREASADVLTCKTTPRAAKDRENCYFHDQMQQQIPIPLAEVVVEDDAAAIDSPAGLASCCSGSSSSSAFSGAADSTGDAAGSANPNLDGFDFMPEDDADKDELPTNAEVSKYTFFQQLRHYMEGEKISHSNCKAVEMAFLVKAGTIVHNMDTMKKSNRETVLLWKYLAMINEVKDDCFDNTASTIPLSAMT
jgi:hypothetical protein